MSPNSCSGHRFPAEVIEHAVGRHHRFSLGPRDVETILAVCGIVVSYEGIREWGLRFGWLFANVLKRRWPVARWRRTSLPDDASGRGGGSSQPGARGASSLLTTMSAAIARPALCRTPLAPGAR